MQEIGEGRGAGTERGGLMMVILKVRVRVTCNGVFGIVMRVMMSRCELADGSASVFEGA